MMKSIDFNLNLPEGRSEIYDPMNFYSHKCGYFKVENDTFFLCCGCNMILLWKLVEGPPLDETLMRDHQLVYIRPYTNSDYRSFYLSPNIWRVESFQSLKVIGSPPNPRLVVNIVEDYRFMETGRENLTSYDEEIILPVTRNTNSFDSNIFEGACQAFYLLNIEYIQHGNRTSQRYRVRKRSWIESILNLILYIVRTV